MWPVCSNQYCHKKQLSHMGNITTNTDSSDLKKTYYLYRVIRDWKGIQRLLPALLKVHPVNYTMTSNKSLSLLQSLTILRNIFIIMSHIIIPQLGQTLREFGSSSNSLALVNSRLNRPTPQKEISKQRNRFTHMRCPPQIFSI